MTFNAPESTRGESREAGVGDLYCLNGRVYDALTGGALEEDPVGYYDQKNAYNEWTIRNSEVNAAQSDPYYIGRGAGWVGMVALTAATGGMAAVGYLAVGRSGKGVKAYLSGQVFGGHHTYFPAFRFGFRPGRMKRTLRRARLWIVWRALRGIVSEEWS